MCEAERRVKLVPVSRDERGNPKSNLPSMRENPVNARGYVPSHTRYALILLTIKAVAVDCLRARAQPNARTAQRSPVRTINFKPTSMHKYFVRSMSCSLIVAALFVTACGDSQVGNSKLEAIHEGTSRDSVFTILGEGPLSATGSDTARVVKGFRHMRYLTAGKLFEVVYYREQMGSVTEPVEQAIETPIVIADNKTLGWGWKFYVDAMKKYNLPTPLVEKVAKKDSQVTKVDSQANSAKKM